jgi:hypothetical protein
MRLSPAVPLHQPPMEMDGFPISFSLLSLARYTESVIKSRFHQRLRAIFILVLDTIGYDTKLKILKRL